MIGFDEAVALVLEAALPLHKERVALDRAHGRHLAAPVVAAVDSPPADVSAMDGYALREADLPLVRRVGTSWPGAPFERAIGPGECVRIFTGAAVPAGADRVVVQEIVRAEGERVVVEGPVSAGRHIRRRASDFAAGHALLAPGTRLGPRALVAAAGADLAEVDVWRRPRVAVLGTGDELAAAGEARHSPGSIPESVSPGIAALAVEYGGDCIWRARLRDDPAAIAAAAARALEEAELVVMIGGASVGEKDYAKAAFDDLGLDLLFSKVAIKPGKPVWLGRAKGRLVIGLPGNPTSALVTARLLLAPLLLGLAGGDPEHALRWRRAPLAAPLPACGDRETFVRGRWNGAAADAGLHQDSGAQHALAQADLLIRRRAGAPAAGAGDMVEVIAF